MPQLIAVIGPSATGKSSLVRELHRRGLIRVHPTWTTRPRRPDEVDGTLEHRFVTDEVFDQLSAERFFVATTTLFGLPWRYGLPPYIASTDGRVDVVMLRAPLVEQVRDKLGLSLVVQVDDDPARLGERLITRQSAPEDVRARLADNRREAALGRRIADITLTNDGTIDDLADRAALVLLTHAGRPTADSSGGAAR